MKYSKNFRSIKHLPGSLLLESSDKILNTHEALQFTDKLLFPDRDRLIITEKLDGANIAVQKRNGKLISTSKIGHECYNAEFNFLKLFHRFVDENSDRFNIILNEGERVIGEWLIRTHSIKYNLPHEPFVMYAIKNENTSQPIQLPFDIVTERAKLGGFTIPKILYDNNKALSVEDAIELLGEKGYHGAVDQAEGVVYRRERDNKFDSYAKYVIPGFEAGKYLMDKDRNELDEIYNTWYGNFKI